MRPAFTADSHFVVFSIEPTKAELNKAKKDKKRPDDMPKNALGIMESVSGQVAKIDRVKNFQVPEDVGGFIAYLMEAKPRNVAEQRRSRAKGESRRRHHQRIWKRLTLQRKRRSRDQQDVVQRKSTALI